MKLNDILNVENFSVEDIDTSELDKISAWLPANSIIDLNIAEKGLVATLHGQSFCQDLITKVDILISIKESAKNRAWSNAALDKATAAGHKTANAREYFAQADEEYIKQANELHIAKACKKYFENKASLFENWHYAFKTFLKRDYDLERNGNFQADRNNGTEEEVFSRPKPRSSGVSSDMNYVDEEFCEDLKNNK